MKILSIDTASDICGVSILDNDNLIINNDICTGRTHSENLMPLIQDTLFKSNLSLNDIDLLVCDKGPGSFTGIRIGVSTVKGFHDSLDIPCIGITSLEALAYNINEDGLICSIIDCKNDNCYFALYEKKGNDYIELIPPSSDNIINALNLCKERYISTNSLIFIGDGSVVYEDKIKKNFDKAVFTDLNVLNSYSLGLAGFNKCKSNNFDEVLPLYLKKPQAQRQLEEKLNKINNQ